MSSIIKKKGALNFKPKASQTRKQPGNIDRGSQTPAPTAKPLATSSSPEREHFQCLVNEQSEPQHLTDVASPAQSLVSDSAANRDCVPKILRHTAQGPLAERIHEGVEDTFGRRPIPEQAESVTEDEATVQDAENLPTVTTRLPSRNELATATTNHDSLGIAQSEIQILPVAGDELSVVGARVSIRPSQLTPIAELHPEGTSSTSVTNKHPSKRRKLDKNKVNVIEVQIRSTGLPGPKKLRRKRAKGVKKKKREVTPDDAEEQEIDPTTVKMSDLTKDLRIGKKFSKHDEIRMKHMQKKKRGNLVREDPEMIVEENNDHGQSRSDLGQEQIIPESSTGPQMRIVNGQIVIDDRSLVVDRHKMAAAAASIMEEVEENELTNVTTCGTYMKREKNITWTSEDNEKFYNALRMLGTDFEMISKMFPNRSRRQIKLKFNKEEREFPEKIADALSGEKVEMNLDEYKSHTGREYEEIEAIEAERQRMVVEHNAEQQKIQAQADEMNRRKKATIQGS